jgi:nicotinate phosphoribosyltransferase
MLRDVVTLEGDRQPGEPLIEPVMRNGRRLQPPATLDAIRARVRDNLARLPAPLAALQDGWEYPVQIAPALEALASEVDRSSAG